ncbi:MAG: hypothetical protein VX529_06480 [Pseudomonadota bacterium]|nr:hypothetical protein [Pseudomonadota bacterium]
METDLTRVLWLSGILLAYDHVPLTLTERRLMLTLLAYSPEPVPMEDLMASWPQGRKPNADSVRKMVSKLRQQMRRHSVRIDAVGEGRYFVSEKNADRAIAALRGGADDTA